MFTDKAKKRKFIFIRLIADIKMDNRDAGNDLELPELEATKQGGGRCVKHHNKNFI